MLNLFEHVFFWHWLGLAAIVLVFEIITGSGFLLWVGLAAGVVGILLFFFPALSWVVQLLTFSVLTVAGWFFYLKHYPLKKRKSSMLNRRGEQQIGRIFMLDTPIINGMGKVRIDDSVWRVRCADLPAGTQIKIIGIDGIILIAEKYSDDNED
jgi:membrane protein implicated in regulation of membrane protease activity